MGVSVIPEGSGEMVAATIRTIFIQPTAEAVHHQLDAVADMLGQQFPMARKMLLDAKEDLTAFAAFPISHWKKIPSSSPLERINREIKRRTDAVHVFPTRPPSNGWSPPCSARCTTNGSPPPPLLVRRQHDDPFTPPNVPTTPPMHSPTPRTLRTIDRLHHHRGRDLLASVRAPAVA